MTESVEYELRLKDGFSGPLNSAGEAAKGFHGKVMEIVSALGIMELAHGAFDFLKESVTAFEENNLAAAQLEATLKSTAYAAGLNEEALAKQRDELVKTSLFSDNAVTSMQSLLLTFTNIKGEVVGGASQAIADMSAKMGTDMQGTVIQVGKALQDPVNGIAALHRVGVNFTESQKAVIEQLVATGKTAEAQKLILKELNTEFGGSAAAAAKAAPWAMIKKQFEEMQEAVGGFITQGIAKIAPYAQEAIGWLKDVVNSFQSSPLFSIIVENVKMAIAFIGPLVTHVVSGFKMLFNSLGQAFNAVRQFFGPIQQLLMWLQPAISAIIDAIFAFVNWIINAFRIVVDVIHTIYVALDKLGVITVIGKAFEAIGWVIKKIGDGISWVYEHTLKPIFDAISWAYDKVKDLLGIKTKAEVAVTETKTEDVTSPAMDLGGMQPGKMDIGKDLKPKTDKVAGQSHVTINVTIQKMTGIEKFVSTTVKGGADAAGEAMIKMLLGTVNQFSASTDI